MRRRKHLLIAIIATIALGLASRKIQWLFPAFLGKYPGDVLWAQMVYWGLAFLTPSASIPKVTGFALLIACLDEFSQLYQAPWAQQIRATSVGHLILGSTFSWWDMVAYAIGIGICSLFEILIFRSATQKITSDKKLE
jgi:hypothetical protein